MLCNKSKNIIASLMIAICFFIFCSPNINFNVKAATTVAATENTPKFIATRLIKSKNYIKIDGIFLNASKDRVYNFKNVKLSVKTKSDTLIKSFTFNDNNLKDINLPAGNSIQWRFFLRDPALNVINLANVKITCDGFNYLTEFNNSFDNGIHMFFKNIEYKPKSKEPYIDKATNTIFIPTEMVIDLSKDLKLKNLHEIIKHNWKDNTPQKKKGKNVVNDYIPLSDLEKLIFPKYHIYYEQNDNYCIIIIF